MGAKISVTQRGAFNSIAEFSSALRWLISQKTRNVTRRQELVITRRNLISPVTVESRFSQFDMYGFRQSFLLMLSYLSSIFMLFELIWCLDRSQCTLIWRSFAVSGVHPLGMPSALAVYPTLQSSHSLHWMLYTTPIVEDSPQFLRSTLDVWHNDADLVLAFFLVLPLSLEHFSGARNIHSG